MIDEEWKLIRDSAQLAEQQTIVDAVATMLLTAARIAHTQGRHAEAEETVERVLYLGYKYSLARLVIYSRAELARQATFDGELRSEEHTSELQSLMRISYAVFCLKKKTLKSQN